MVALLTIRAARFCHQNYSCTKVKKFSPSGVRGFVIEITLPIIFLILTIQGVNVIFIVIVIVILTIRCSRGAAGVVAAKAAGIRSTEFRGRVGVGFIMVIMVIMAIVVIGESDLLSQGGQMGGVRFLNWHSCLCIK